MSYTNVGLQWPIWVNYKYWRMKARWTLEMMYTDHYGDEP